MSPSPVRSVLSTIDKALSKPQREYRNFVKPEVPGDLKFWLGLNAEGTRLQLQGSDKQPELRTFTWHWEITASRVQAVLR